MVLSTQVQADMPMLHQVGVLNITKEYPWARPTGVVVVDGTGDVRQRCGW